MSAKNYNRQTTLSPSFTIMSARCPSARDIDDLAVTDIRFPRYRFVNNHNRTSPRSDNAGVQLFEEKWMLLLNCHFGKMSRGEIFANCYFSLHFCIITLRYKYSIHLSVHDVLNYHELSSSGLSSHDCTIFREVFNPKFCWSQDAREKETVKRENGEEM